MEETRERSVSSRSDSRSSSSSWRSGSSLINSSNISWDKRAKPTEPGPVAEMAEMMAATRYAMEEEEAEQIGARTTGSEFVEEANLEEIEEECHSDAQGRERPSGKRRAFRKPKVHRKPFAIKGEQRDTGPVVEGEGSEGMK
jgi:hypothetical protein